MATDVAHGEAVYDVNGAEIMVGGYSSRLIGETSMSNAGIMVTRLDDVAPPSSGGYGTTTATSYVRRYYLPCSVNASS